MKQLILVLFLKSFLGFSQTITNGNLEINSCVFPVCYDNNSNAKFNGFYSNSPFAWGDGEEIDIYNQCGYFSNTPYPDWYISLDVNRTKPLTYDAVNFKITGINTGDLLILSMWVASPLDSITYPSTPLTIGLSMSRNTQGSIVGTIPAPSSDNKWHHCTLIFNAPLPGNYLSVKASGDTSHRWTAIDNLEFVSALPIGLSDFYGKQEENVIVLKWITESEINNDYFLVYRLSKEYLWEVIGKISGHGNSTETHVYYYLDKHPLSEDNYYYLGSFDYDNTKYSSKEILVKFKEKPKEHSFLEKYTLLGQDR